MSDRITRANLDERCANVNRRIQNTGRRVVAEGRNGYIGLDEYRVTDRLVRGTNLNALECVRTLTVGTKREVGEFLHAMMVGIDLSRTQVEFPVLR